MLNIGFVLGARLAQNARADGCPPALATVAIWIPALCGGLLLNMGCPMYLLSRRGSWSLFVSGPQSIGFWLRSSLMGALWFGAFLLYGYGASMIGSEGAVYGWALLVGTSILASNAWGAITGEWKGAGVKPKILMALSTLIMVWSIFLLAAQQLPG
jgi:hypothetical protein